MTEETAGTPRVDAEARVMCSYCDPWESHHGYYVLADFARQLEREVAALTTQRGDEKRLKNEVTLLAHRYKQRLEDAEAQLDELQKRIGYTAVPQDSQCESPASLGHMFEGHERHSNCPCVRQACSYPICECF